MGWIGATNLVHINTFVNEFLHQAGTTRSYVPPEALTKYLGAPERRREPLEIWYTAPSGIDNGEEYIGVIILEHDAERSKELKASGRGEVYNDASGELDSVKAPAVQVWCRKEMSVGEGPRYYQCPLEYLLLIAPANEYDRNWRSAWLYEHPEVSETEKDAVLG